MKSQLNGVELVSWNGTADWNHYAPNGSERRQVCSGGRLQEVAQQNSKVSGFLVILLSFGHLAGDRQKTFA